MKSWWRIQVDASGKVVDCREVEQAEVDGADVFFVQARDRAEAGRKAWNAYCRVTGQRRRARLIAEGKCAWCGRINDREQRKRCTICLDADAKRERDSRARARGEDVPPPNRAASIAARAEEQRQQIRAEAATATRVSVLLEVHEAWLARLQAMRLETDVSRAIREALEAIGCRTLRLHAGRVKVPGGWMRHNEAGTPDLLVVAPYMFLETKVPVTGRLSAAQELWHARAEREDVKVVVVRSVSEAIAAVVERRRQRRSAHG